MRTVLDFVGIAIFIVGVVGLAAALTALTVRISPTRDPSPPAK